MGNYVLEGAYFRFLKLINFVASQGFLLFLFFSSANLCTISLWRQALLKDQSKEAEILCALCKHMDFMNFNCKNKTNYLLKSWCRAHVSWATDIGYEHLGDTFCSLRIQVLKYFE